MAVISRTWALSGAFVLAGLAQAQPVPPPGVQLYGLVDANVGRFTAATGVNAQEQSASKMSTGGLSTSHWGVRGTEDLGGGVSAQFDLSSFVRNDTGASGRSDAIGAPVNVAADPMFSRAAWVGVTSPTLGRLRAGNITSLMFVNTITSNALGDSTNFSPLNLLMFIGSPLTGGTGWGRSVVYDSPNWSGFTGSLAYADDAGGTLGGSNKSARLAYAQGPLAASLAWQSVKRNPVTFADGTSPNDTESWLLGGSYDFKTAKVMAHVGHIRNRGTAAAPVSVDYRVWDISASVPLTSGQVVLAYGSRATSDTPAPVPATAAGGNVSRKLLTVGYTHRLSPRTELYALAMHDQTRTRTLPAPPTVISANSTSWAVGVRHRF